MVPVCKARLAASEVKELYGSGQLSLFTFIITNTEKYNFIWWICWKHSPQFSYHLFELKMYRFPLNSTAMWSNGLWLQKLSGKQVLSQVHSNVLILVSPKGLFCVCLTLVKHLEEECSRLINIFLTWDSSLSVLFPSFCLINRLILYNSSGVSSFQFLPLNPCSAFPPITPELRKFKTRFWFTKL